MKKSLRFVVTLLAAGTILLVPSQAQQTQQPSTSSAQQPPRAAAGQAPAAMPKKAPGAKPSQAATTKAAPVLELKTPKDKASYTIGMNIGKSLMRDGVDVDPAILMRGIRDVLGGGKLLLTDQEAQATINTLRDELRKKQELQMEQLAEANKKEGDEFLAANKTKDGVVALPSGLQYKVLQEGTGPKPAAADTVVVNYRGTFLNGTEFDSSYKHGQPLTIQVAGQIIKGWTEALELMPVGSKWQLFIPSDLAYGPSGRLPVIGPNSTLVFEIELVSIQPQAAPSGAPTPGPAPAASTATSPTPPATPPAAQTATPTRTPTPKP